MKPSGEACRMNQEKGHVVMRRLDEIIGYNLLKELKVQIDYLEETLRL